MAVPLLESFFGILGEVSLAFSGRDLAPRWRVVQHEADMLWRSGERSIYRRGEGVDEVRPPRVVEPDEAPAESAEVPLRFTDRYPVRPATALEPRIVDREVLLALYLQGVRVGPEVDRIPSSARRLAADGAVAGLIRVRRLGLDPEADRAAVTRTFEQHARLPPAASPAADLYPLRVERDVDVAVLHLHLVLRDGLHRRQAPRRAGLHVELRAVEGARNLRVRKLAFAQVRELVGADILEGVKLAFHVAQGHETILD